MTTTDKNSEEEAFLASKQAMWSSFVWICGGAMALIVLILVLMAAFLL
jgi:hypothetical protein